MPNASLTAVVDAIARASLILASAGLVATALGRSSAAVRHLVWVLGLVSALLVPVFALALPRWEVPIVRIAAADHADVSAADRADVRAAEGTSFEAADRQDRDAAAGFTRRSPSPIREASALSTPAILLLIWAAGAAIVLGRLLLGLVVVWWMSRRMREVAEGPWLPLARGLAADLGLTGVRFVQSATASMPMAWGVIRASVLMPADADTWPAHRLRIVLLHELAHVKRRDCLTHVVAQVVCAAYWFNPLAWMAAGRLRAERERACDDLVLAAGTRGSDYADELLDIARVIERQRFPAVLGGASLAMAHRSQLEGRLIAILDPNLRRRGLTRARAAAAAGVFAVLILSVASVQPWAETPAVVQETISGAPGQVVNRPIESHPGQTTDPSGTAREESTPQPATQDDRAPKPQESLHGAIDRSVNRIVEDTVGAVTGSVANGIAGGVVQGVTRGVTSHLTNGIVEGVVGGVLVGALGDIEIQANPHPRPNPNPNPNPRASADGRPDPRAVAALMEALKDSDKDVRETAMHALVEMRDPRVFDPLVAALKDPSADIREQAVFGLGQLRDPRAVEPLTTVLHDSSADVRQNAVFALGQLRDKRAVDPLVSALKDDNPQVREQAAFALGQIRDPRAVEALVIALKDSTADVRAQAAFALGQLRDPRAIDGLTGALKDSNTDVRRQAAFALGQIRY